MKQSKIKKIQLNRIHLLSFLLFLTLSCRENINNTQNATNKDTEIDKHREDVREASESKQPRYKITPPAELYEEFLKIPAPKELDIPYNQRGWYTVSLSDIYIAEKPILLHFLNRLAKPMLLAGLYSSLSQWVSTANAIGWLCTVHFYLAASSTSTLLDKIIYFKFILINNSLDIPLAMSRTPSCSLILMVDALKVAIQDRLTKLSSFSS